MTALQREDVDAAKRGLLPSTSVDHRGLAIATQAADALVGELGDQASWAVFRDEVTVTVTPATLTAAAAFLRDTQGFALLSDISPCDREGSERAHPARFNVDYMVTKLVPGAPRVRLRVWVAEGAQLPSLIPLFPTADWHEREAFDFFGIEFTGRAGLRRLIMPDDWVGHPLRKDYPIGGEPVKFTNSVREL
ncbi:MAG: NADH-quinone oxidoreductase subunit C [Thermoleophilia bacterium]|nr:NADH-quinone oxidoreductase subunit C [Thermoleophilia bacterium]